MQVWFFRSGIKQWKGEIQDSLYVFHKSISKDYALEVKKSWEDFYGAKTNTSFRVYILAETELDIFLLKAFDQLKGNIDSSWFLVPKGLEPKEETP